MVIVLGHHAHIYPLSFTLSCCNVANNMHSMPLESRKYCFIMYNANICLPLAITPYCNIMDVHCVLIESKINIYHVDVPHIYIYIYISTADYTIIKQYKRAQCAA